MASDPHSRSSLLPAIVGALLGMVAGAFMDGTMGSPILYAVVGALIGLRVRDGRRIDALEAQMVRRLETVRDRTPAEARPTAAEPVSPPVAEREAAPVFEAALRTGIAAEPVQLRRAESDSTPTPEPTAEPRRVGTPPAPRRPWIDLPPELAEPARRAWAFATGGNPIVRVALVVLFVGFGIGIRYAAQAGLFPVELRLVASGLAGLGLVGLGWSLRRSSPPFALAVQGGGIALLYLTVYAAYAVVGILGAPLALAGMAAVALACGALAVVQNAPGLAFLGALGGFAAPVVASTGSGSHVLLFSYYLALGLGIAGLVWTRGWRSLAVLGVVGTFGVGGWWGGLEYRSELYATTQPFLIAFFALYFVLALRLAWLDLRAGAVGDRVPERALAVDSTLVFGLPVATFLLQRGLVEGMRFGDAWSAGALAAVYLGVWWTLRARRAPSMLSDALLAVGLAFATLAAPLAFQRVVAGALWSLEAAALVWTGVRQRRPWMRVAGIALAVGAAGVLFVEGVIDPDRAFRPETLTGWLVGVSLILCAYVLWRARRPGPADLGIGDLGIPQPSGGGIRPAEALAGRALLAGGIVWWGLTAWTHAEVLTSGDAERSAVLGALGLSALLFAAVGRALGWTALTRAALLAAPVAAGGLLAEIARYGFSDGSPLDAWGGLGWTLLAAGLVAGLVLSRRVADRAHVAAFAVGAPALVGVAGLSLAGLVPMAWGSGWVALALTAPLAAGLGVLAADARRREHTSWLDALTSPTGRLWAGGGLGLAAAVGALALSATAGAAAPLPEIPLLTPPDLGVVALLAALAGWLWASGTRGVGVGWALGSLFLIAITGAVGRGVAALTPIPFQTDALFDSSVFQTALAIAWALFALALTVRATRTESRPFWFAGAAVLALVVVKLFAVDLSRADALVRVGAFLGVGALMLWIGYRSPLPPRADGGAPGPPADGEDDVGSTELESDAAASAS